MFMKPRLCLRSAVQLLSGPGILTRSEVKAAVLLQSNCVSTESLQSLYFPTRL